MANILIAGGTGMIGSNLSNLLVKKGFNVVHLSRGATNKKFKTFTWDVNNGKIDPNCLTNIDAIINLAGAGIADKKWTTAVKKDIYDSRIKATKLLYNLVSNTPNSVKTFISASAIGIYPFTCVEPTTEDATKGDNFLADVCKDWETEATKFNNLGIRTAIVRIGIVLSNTGGFVDAISKPAKFGFGAALGNGNMITSWIHIDDLAEIFVFLLNHKLEGAFNAVAPNPVTNKEITAAICKALNRPFILPNVPEFALKLLMGEMSAIALSNQNISAQKIINSGFNYRFNKVDEALADLF